MSEEDFNTPSFFNKRHQPNHFDNISEWYPCISDYTFKTQFLPLSEIEGKALLKVRENGRMIGSFFNICSTEEEKEKALNMDPIIMLKEAQPDLEKALKELEKKIEKILKDYPLGAFIRMNTRSPKDSALKGKLVRKLIKESIEKHPINDPYSKDCAIIDGIIYWSCISKACHVTSGYDAIELLCGSNRVQEDLQLGFLSHGEALQLVIREWENIHPEYEFRVFVVNNIITGITQYHKGLYVPKLIENKDKIVQLIENEFDKVKDKIIAPDGKYTIDFVICEDFNSVRIIEINDPPPTAGTSLYDWDIEEDRKLLLNGPFSFRILTEPLSWIEQQKSSSMHPPLIEYIDNLRGRIKKEEEEHIEDNNNSLCVVS